MINIPASIKVGGITYIVQETDEAIVVNGSECRGSIDFERSIIKISKQSSKQMQCVTLLHELLHAMLFERDIVLDDDIEEKIVVGLSRSLYQILVDNINLVEPTSTFSNTKTDDLCKEEIDKAITCIK